MRLKEFFVTGFYSGYFPIAPGTAGTLLAALIFILEHVIFKSNCIISNLIIVFVLIVPSIKLGDAAETIFKRKDPSYVVLDEMIGFWVSVLFIPFSWQIVLLAFILFRVMDIFKPYPIRKFEKLDGGLGIMLDDIFAGIYANIMIHIIIFLTPIFNIQVL